MKLRELIGDDWFDKLSPFLKSKEFKAIGTRLQEELSLINSELVPSISEVFQPFKDCRIKDLNAVFINDKPFTPFETVNFYDGIEMEVYEGFNLKQEKDIEHLSKQGILWLNTSLTLSLCEDKFIEHYDLWHPFVQYLLEQLAKDNTGLVFITCGKKAREFADIILKSQNYLLTCSRPKNENLFDELWDSGGVFELTNRILKLNNNIEIKW